MHQSATSGHHGRARCSLGSHTNSQLHTPLQTAKNPALMQRRSCRRAPCKAGSTEDPGLPAPVREVAVLGGEDYIYSQMSGVSEELFKGDRLGVFADIASVDFRQNELHSLAHLPDEFQPPERFLDRVALHFAKNLLASQGSISGQVPLILGIWGHKGAGKSFNLELCCKAMGVQPVIISAGELEDELAGEPGRHLRERYRFAARYAVSSGVPTCLIINDLDAGVGRYASTDNTVNCQNLQGTLMAICDDPTMVSMGQAWEAAGRSFSRVPIFITANDLQVLYQPLVREGRMEKFFFDPSREECLQLLSILFAELTSEEASALLDAFPSQPLDFFGAIRSRLTDAAVRAWIRETSAENMQVSLLGTELMYANNAAAWRTRQRLTVSSCVSLETALQAGRELAHEQQKILDLNLVREYYRFLDPEPVLSRRAAAAKEAPLPPPSPPLPILSEDMADYWSYMASNSTVAQKEKDEAEMKQEEEAEQQLQQQEQQQKQEEAAAARGWPLLSPDQVHAAMASRRVAVLDVRSIREWEWGKIKGAFHMPIVLTSGTSMNPIIKPNPDFVKQVVAKFPGSDQALVLYGSSTEVSTGREAVKGAFVSKALALNSRQDFVAEAAGALKQAGYSNVSELAGGYTAWDLAYRPDGRRREKGKWADKSSGDLEWWTASN